MKCIWQSINFAFNSGFLPLTYKFRDLFLPLYLWLYVRSNVLRVSVLNISQIKCLPFWHFCLYCDKRRTFCLYPTSWFIKTSRKKVCCQENSGDMKGDKRSTSGWTFLCGMSVFDRSTEDIPLASILYALNLRVFKKNNDHFLLS